MKLIDSTNFEYTTSPPLLGRCCYSQLFSFTPSIYKKIKMSNGVPESGAVVCHSNGFPCWVAVISFCLINNSTSKSDVVQKSMYSKGLSCQRAIILLCNSFSFFIKSLSSLNFVSNSEYVKPFLLKTPSTKTIKNSLLFFKSISIRLWAKELRRSLYFLSFSKSSLYSVCNDLNFFLSTLFNKVILGSNINLGFTNSIKFNFNSLLPTNVVDNVSPNKNSMSINKDINIPRKWISSFDTSVFCFIVGLFTMGYNGLWVALVATLTDKLDYNYKL